MAKTDLEKKKSLIIEPAKWAILNQYEAELFYLKVPLFIFQEKGIEVFDVIQNGVGAGQERGMPGIWTETDKYSGHTGMLETLSLGVMKI